MKILLIVLLTAAAVLAETYTVTLTTTDDARFEEAVGSVQNLRDPGGSPRPATVAECDQFLLSYVTGTTQDYEKRKAMAASTPVPISPAPLPPVDVMMGTFRPADVSAGSDLIRFAGLSDGNQIRFAKSSPNNNLPGGITEGTYYFVINSTPTQFQLSDTPGGSLLDITAAGTGNTNEIWRRQGQGAVGTAGTQSLKMAAPTATPKKK